MEVAEELGAASLFSLVHADDSGRLASHAEAAKQAPNYKLLKARSPYGVFLTYTKSPSTLHVLLGP